MACPICGEHCTCAREREGSARAAVLESEPRGEDPSSPDAEDHVWRQEVASRVDAFCARRGRKRLPRTPSLSLDFERAARATAAAHYAVPEPQVDPAQEPVPEPEASNLIEFPRPVEPPPYLEPLPTIEELAEPILDKPRILDAEEPSGLLFGGRGRPAITLESPPEPQTADEAGPAGEHASLLRRILAATLDGVLIAIAAAAFAAIFLHIAGTLPNSRTALLLALVLPVLLWAMYQYLFLVHAAATPGMRVTGLRVRTFDNLPARRSLRRWRALAMMISGMALGLGFLWASIDEYGLCWHDRITRTVLRRS
jgi:uncharacterized RDD family membrane protein YckC